MMRHMKKTPVEYVNHVRMEHAKRLLTHTDKSIEEISEECGIKSRRHFYRLFKEATGGTPKQYRQQHAVLVPMYRSRAQQLNMRLKP
jgi:AraC family cel operon transcriptional repressor